jgi:hypothetical protein
MLQQAATYILLFSAISYVVYRFYSMIKKKEACDKCGLMQAAKDAKKQNS